MLPSMIVTPIGILTDFNCLQLAKALSPMEVTFSGIVMAVSVSHPSNALLPMAVTLSGIILFLHPHIKVFVAVSIIELQLLRESYTEFSLATEIAMIPLQCEKAAAPISDTEAGKDNVDNFWHPVKALLPIFIKLRGSISFSL